jgi:anti-sigma factor RsiW
MKSSAEIIPISNDKLDRLKRIGALLDGEISDPVEKARLEAELQNSPEDLHLLEELQQQKSELKRLVHREALQQTAGKGRGGLVRFMVAASVSLTILGIGVAGGVYGTTSYLSSEFVAAEQFAQEALVSYQYLTAANDIPVQLAASQVEELTPILSQYFGADVQIPRKVGADFSLKNIGIFTDESGPAVQVSYENPTGQRLAFRIGVAEQGPASEHFEWQVKGDVRTCFWRSTKAKFALTGPYSREEMLDLAKSITALGPPSTSSS